MDYQNWIRSSIRSSRGDRYLVFSISAGVVLGFFSGIILIPAMLDSQKLPDSSLLSKGSHHYSNIESQVGLDIEMKFHQKDKNPHRGEDAVAQEMAKKVRVLCWIMTRPPNHKTNSRHIKATWGKRCNVLLFISPAHDSTLPIVALPVQDDREYLWANVKEGFKYAYEKYKEEVDWFMKADDETYVVVENLRYMLSSFDPKSPLCLGCRFKPYVKQGHMSGGGYVLSKESLRRFVEEAMPDRSKCLAEEREMEDTEIARCLENVGVKATDARDIHGRDRFFPLESEFHLTSKHAKKHDWFWNSLYASAKDRLDFVSDTSILFHHPSPDMMYTLEYFIYHLRPYGINYKFQITETNTTC